MIAYIKGKIIYKAEYLIVETQGIGYKIFVAGIILEQKKVQEEISLYIHQHIREDAITLFGFITMEELRFFEQLISVSGVGPKSALSIISKYKIADVKKSIVHEDTSLLTKVSGIGKKTAERIIVELKSKMDVIDGQGEYQPLSKIDNEATQALISLGYSKAQAVEALEKIDNDLTLENKIKQALKIV
ncbi:MAG: Holliday junction branch migration protein RuvA [Patescibacteria group bacterium]